MYRGALDMQAPTHLLCCFVGNALRDPRKTKPLSLKDFNPWATQKSLGRNKIPLNKQSIGMLKVFLNN